MAITKVVMPKLSEAMESGKIIKWLKKEGDRVQAGDILAEVETDKADVEMEAFGGGVLRKILAQAGEKTPVGALIGVIAEPSDDISALLAGAPAPVVAPIGAAPSPAVRTVTRPEPAPAVPAGVTAGRVKASPIAKKIAAQSGVDLRLLQGTGPGGRIIRRDVEQASTRAGAAMPATAVPAVAGPEYEDR